MPVAHSLQALCVNKISGPITYPLNYEYLMKPAERRQTVRRRRRRAWSGHETRVDEIHSRMLYSIAICNNYSVVVSARCKSRTECFRGDLAGVMNPLQK